MPTSPAEIRLTFSEPLEEGLFQLHLYDQHGRPIPLADGKLAEDDATQLLASLPLLPDGTYTMVWSVVSADGHPVRGTVSFSVGQAFSPGGPPVGAETATVGDKALLVFRYGTEGLLLVVAGLTWFSWLERRHGLPDETAESRRWRGAVWLLLCAGWLGQGLLYLAALPGNGLTAVWREGGSSLLVSSPFLAMIGAQLVFLALLVLPGMVAGWYQAIWLLSVCGLAFGGHAWGIQPFWLAVLMRILHLVSLSLWLGALTYLLLALRRERLDGIQVDWASLRRLFLHVAIPSSAVVLLSGVAMTFQQTDWSSLWPTGQVWSLLLGLKGALIAVMLLFALIQTVRWHQAGRLTSRAMLRREWGVGALAILAGVCMSQMPYPLPVKSYIKDFQTPDAHVQVQVPRLAPGTQTMTVVFHAGQGAEPERVTIRASRTGSAVTLGPISARKTGPGHYQADIPFAQYGRWTYHIDAAVGDGNQIQITDTLFIPGGGEP